MEIKCTGCGQILRVQESDADKQGRCPKCKTTFAIPSNEPSGAGSTFGGVEPKPGPFGQQEQSPYGQPTQPPFGEPGKNPFSDNPPAPTENPYASPQGAYQQIRSHGYRQPHRGGTILAFGIIGLFCCGFLGIAAWVMGNEDMRKIDAGIMDPSGRGTTQAGRIIGIIATVKMGFNFFLYLAAMAAG